MASLQTRILSRAAGEIGYNRHTDPHRGTKYARETQPVLWPRDTWLLANGISYCDIFITWVFWKEGLLDILPAGASYNTDVRASKGGRISKSSARPGDVLVFDWNPSTAATNHVGILEKRLSSGNIQTIEGNTSVSNAGSQGNGGRVARRTRRWDQVKYVIRPRWDDAEPVKVKPVAKPVVKPVAKPTPVKTKGIAPLKVDGKLGEKSAVALQLFLVSRGANLKVDGKVGEKTWEALQHYLKAPFKDGKISRQSHKASEIGSAITGGWEYTGKNSKGSQSVRLLQAWVGVKVDGIAGPDTVKGLQRKLNEHKVGYAG